MVVVDEIAERPSVREGAVEVLHGDAIEGTDGVAPLKEQREGRFEEYVGLKRRPTRVDELGGNRMWFRVLKDFYFIFEFLLIKLQLHL